MSKSDASSTSGSTPDFISIKQFIDPRYVLMKYAAGHYTSAACAVREYVIAQIISFARKGDRYWEEEEEIAAKFGVPASTVNSAHSSEKGRKILWRAGVRGNWNRPWILKGFNEDVQLDYENEKKQIKDSFCLQKRNYDNPSSESMACNALNNRCLKKDNDGHEAEVIMTQSRQAIKSPDAGDHERLKQGVLSLETGDSNREKRKSEENKKEVLYKREEKKDSFSSSPMGGISLNNSPPKTDVHDCGDEPLTEDDVIEILNDASKKHFPKLKQYPTSDKDREIACELLDYLYEAEVVDIEGLLHLSAHFYLSSFEGNQPKKVDVTVRMFKKYVKENIHDLTQYQFMQNEKNAFNEKDDVEIINPDSPEDEFEEDVKSDLKEVESMEYQSELYTSLVDFLNRDDLGNEDIEILSLRKFGILLTSSYICMMLGASEYKACDVYGSKLRSFAQRENGQEILRDIYASTHKYDPSPLYSNCVVIPDWRIRYQDVWQVCSIKFIQDLDMPDHFASCEFYKTLIQSTGKEMVLGSISNQ